ncbi:hypothetical protein DBR42_01225 [Pelomonas sp. HMWF004]|nr:hypothetical protein DBR42_01225 [Pelomonas sp. HMWF004]
MLTDADLLVRMDEAQSHEPSTGYMVDPVLAHEIRLELNRRRQARSSRPPFSGPAAHNAGRLSPVCTCHGSADHYWTVLRRKLPAGRFWYRWNMAQTKRVLASCPASDQAERLIALWPPRIQRALRARYVAQATTTT